MRAFATVTSSTLPFFSVQSLESQGHSLCFCSDRFDLRFEQLTVGHVCIRQSQCDSASNSGLYGQVYQHRKNCNRWTAKSQGVWELDLAGHRTLIRHLCTLVPRGLWGGGRQMASAQVLELGLLSGVASHRIA